MEKEQPKSLWVNDAILYFHLLIKPWRYYAEPIPNRLSWEAGFFATLFSMDRLTFLPPFFPLQRFLCWVAYNFGAMVGYATFLAAIGGKENIRKFFRLYPLTFTPLIAYGLFWLVVLLWFLFFILPLAFLLATRGPLVFFFFWALIALWIVVQQVFLLLHTIGERKWLAPLVVLLAQGMGFLASYNLYRFFINICWFL